MMRTGGRARCCRWGVPDGPGKEQSLRTCWHRRASHGSRGFDALDRSVALVQDDIGGAAVGAVRFGPRTVWRLGVAIHERGRPMAVVRRIGLFIAAAGLAA